MFRDRIPVPVIAQCDPSPKQLIDVSKAKCRCNALGTKCSTACLQLSQRAPSPALHTAVVQVNRVAAISTLIVKTLKLETRVLRWWMSMMKMMKTRRRITQNADRDGVPDEDEAHDDDDYVYDGWVYA